MNFVNEFGEKQNGFAEVVAFCHVTCRYFDRFLLQGVDKNWRQACLFYLAPGLICEGYWQVNSRRSIFRIADPTFANAYFVTILCPILHPFHNELLLLHMNNKFNEFWRTNGSLKKVTVTKYINHELHLYSEDNFFP